MSSGQKSTLFVRPNVPKACCGYKKIASTTYKYNPDLFDAIILNFLITEEKKMDQWYCKKNNGFLYYYYAAGSSKNGGYKKRNTQMGGSPGCLFGLRKKKNYIAPLPTLQESSPVQPIPVDEPVDLPKDIVELIVRKTIEETGREVERVNLTSDDTRVRELHEILAKTLNTLSASKFLRRSMYEQLENMRKEQVVAKEANQIILKDLNLRIHMMLAEVRIAIESYDVEKGSRIKCVTKRLYNFLRDVGLEDMANDLIPNIFVSLKDWNIDAYVAMIENAVRARAIAKPGDKALLLLPYGNFNKNIASIFDCMMNIMLNVPSQRSSCTLILSDTTGTHGVNIKFEYQKITFIPLINQDRKEIQYNYKMTEKEKSQIRCRFVHIFTDMIETTPYLKFLEFNVAVNGIENIIVDFETIVNTYPLSFFIGKGAANLPEGRKWLLFTPLKYLVGKFEKELYAEVCESHRKDKDKIYRLLGAVQQALTQMKNPSSGGRKKIK